MRRVIAVIYGVPGVGWVVATLAVLLYHQQRGELPMTPFGFRLLGSTYPDIGISILTPLGWALAWVLIAVSIIDVLIGRWFWHGNPRAAALALVMAPVSFALGWLFALPYLLVMAPLRAIAVVVTRRREEPREPRTDTASTSQAGT